MRLFWLLLIFTHVIIGSCNAKRNFIIVPINSTLVESHAAKILQKHLNNCGKDTWVIKVEDSGLCEQCLYVGNTNYFLKSKIEDFNSLVEDGVYIRKVNGSFFLNGKGSRGQLYSVYEFLEKVIGVNFWGKGIVDYVSNYQLPKSFNYIYSPTFAYRGFHNYDVNLDPELATVFHLNGHFQKIQNEWGEPINVAGWAHTFNQILPVDRYFLKHPEWFSNTDKDNKPFKKEDKLIKYQESPQLCLSNDLMKKEFLKNTLDWIRKNPNLEYFALSQNDGTGMCMCDRCMQSIKKYGSETDLHIHFINEIANSVSLDFPEIKFVSLAYTHTQEAPVKLRAADNVIIQYAPIFMNMRYSLNSEFNRGLSNNLKQWLNKSNQMFYWGYLNNFEYDLLPYPALSRIGHELKYISSLGIKQVFIQGNDKPDNFGYFNGLHAWVVSKLLWNVSLNEEKLIDDFFYGFYGSGAKDLLSCYRLIEQSIKDKPVYLKAFHTDYSFVSNDVLTTINNNLKRAIAATSGTKYYQRILEAKKSFDYLMVYKKSDYVEPDKVFIQFKDSRRRTVDEDWIVSNYVEYLKNDYLKKVSYFDNLTLHENNGLTVTQEGGTEVISDKYSKRGKSIQMGGNNTAWNVQFRFDGRVSHRHKYTIRVLLRSNVQQLRGGDEDFVQINVLDGHAKVDKFKRNVVLKKLSNHTFSSEVLSNLELQDGDILYFSMNSANPAKKIYIESVNIQEEK